MNKRSVFAAICLGSYLCLQFNQIASAHEGGHHDHPALETTSGPGLLFLIQQSQVEDGTDSMANRPPAITEHFKPFEQSLRLRWDDDYFYVGSDGLPDHAMMIGIRSWQQQVPLPQAYFGTNAWQIPLHPIPAKNPMSTKNDFLRGAIALAVNGVPIFNPLNNRGDDALLAGELDEYGGHCGRGDDYHYHLAPTHLEQQTGPGNPIAYALDGYPIFGFQHENTADYGPLDELGGHHDADGHYHYHAQRSYPYLNGGFHGQVTQRGGQVDPQPQANPIRPAGEPLRGTTITNFYRDKNRFELRYDLDGREGNVSYVVQKDGAVDFAFVEPSGATRTESYRRNLQSGLNLPTAAWFLILLVAVIIASALILWNRSRKQRIIA